MANFNHNCPICDNSLKLFQDYSDDSWNIYCSKCKLYFIGDSEAEVLTILLNALHNKVKY